MIHGLGLDRFLFQQELESLTWGVSALGAFFCLLSLQHTGCLGRNEIAAKKSSAVGLQGVNSRSKGWLPITPLNGGTTPGKAQKQG